MVKCVWTTFPETNILLKINGWNTTFLLGRPMFRGYASFREGDVSPLNHQVMPGRMWKVHIEIVIEPHKSSRERAPTANRHTPCHCISHKKHQYFSRTWLSFCFQTKTEHLD